LGNFDYLSGLFLIRYKTLSFYKTRITFA